MKSKLFVCLTCIFLLSVPCAWTKAKKSAEVTEEQEEKDLSLFQIDRLIRKTEYDEALRQLNNYIAKNPDNFDNAQKRIARIMNARKQYSILAEKLIDIILTEPDNNKEIYEITAQLEKFEKHPSDKNLQFIADLKKSAEFNYFRASFLEIQTESAKLTQQGKYVQAIAKCQEGFWLYKDNFYEKWEDNTELLAQVDAVLATLDSNIQKFSEKRFLSNTQSVVDEFITAVKKDKYDEADALCSQLSNEMSDYITTRNTLMDCGVQFQELFAQVQQMDEDSSDASFLPFMYHFIFGSESIADSGIAGAVNKQWNSYMTAMNDAVFEQLNNKYIKFTSATDESNCLPVTRYAALEKKLLDVNETLKAGNVEAIRNNYAGYYITSAYVANLAKETVRICKIADEVEQEKTVQNNILSSLASQDSSSRSSQIKKLFDSNAKIGNLVGVKSQQMLENMEWASSYLATGDSQWNILNQFYSSTLDNIFDSSSKMLEGSWTTLSEYYKENADSLCTVAETHRQNTDKYNTGFYVKIPLETHKELKKGTQKIFTLVNTFETDENLNFGVYYSYPDIAVQAALLTQAEIDGFISEITSYQNILQENYTSHEQWVIDEKITALVTGADSYLENDKNKLKAYRQASVDAEENARSQIVKAQLAQNEAEIRYAEAEAALRRDNFELARKKLQDAASKYDEALKNQDDSALRSDCDDKLFALGDRITKGENEIVVREVRQLKNKAKDAYLNGRFDDAEKYLTEAKQRWAVTNATEDSEIINLMNFVNTAISMNTGREILPSAPQYPEMSQLLNIANQYYESGVAKINKGDKTGGAEDLQLAMQNIQKVQFTYPLNRDAALMTLRINKFQDPEKFNEELSQKIDLAKMMCKRKDSQQEGYANLLDYYDIEPNYRGLKDLIYQVEIDIGIRQKPVDNSGANKAKKLLAEAQKLFKNAGSDSEKLEKALAKVDESIMLQDSDAAQELKDSITIKIGGSTSVTISTEDETRYRSAVAKLSNDDVLGANRLVQELWKNKRNQSVQKIIDLKNKVEAKL